MIKFYLYDIETGQKFTELPGLPDNYKTMESTGVVYYDSLKRAKGVKFGSAVDWFYSSIGVDGQNEKDQILQDIENENIELSNAEIELNNISGFSYSQVDQFVNNNVTDPGTRAVLKLFGRAILALIKTIKIKLYQSGE